MQWLSYYGIAWWTRNVSQPIRWMQFVDLGPVGGGGGLHIKSYGTKRRRKLLANTSMFAEVNYG